MAEGQQSLAEFNRCVFINCPFDDDYFALLKPMLWLLVRVGLKPRLSLERSNAGEGRLVKIQELIESSRYGIHDLSRLQATAEGELYRLNMPFELGIDYGCRCYSARKEHQSKIFLALEAEPYSAKKALSDIAFADPQPHRNDAETLIEVLRTWLVTNGLQVKESATTLWDKYNAFYFDLFTRLRNEGWTESNINNIPIREFMSHIEEDPNWPPSDLS